MRILGLDEAGRGSVLGPMAVGAFLWEGTEQTPLREAGADDSKRLSARRREALCTTLSALGQSAVHLVSATEIDEGNLNTIEEGVFARLIARFAPDRVYIDAPVNPRGIPAFSARLGRAIRERGGVVPEMVIESKADSTWPVVGAASIFAKVARDQEIKALGAVGSGYPSDPVTRGWIRGYLEREEALPDCVRSRWGTIEALRQQTLFG